MSLKHIVALLVSLLFISCPAKKESPPPVYRQGFKASIAWLTIEWNGRPEIMASGFLINKEKGVFITARHFTDETRKLFGGIKIFFNGKVYDGEILAVPPIRDAALVRIAGSSGVSIRTRLRGKRFSAAKKQFPLRCSLIITR